MSDDLSDWAEMPEFSRRAFVGSLIATAVAANVPLPVLPEAARPVSAMEIWERLFLEEYKRRSVLADYL